MTASNILRTVMGILSVALVGVCETHGHQPEGEQYFAFQFVDEAVPVIDGDLGDWSLVPLQPYSITNPDLFSPNKFIRDVGRGELDPSDINIWHRVGYNPNTELLYFASQVFDDYHDIDRADVGSFWFDDSLEIRLNATAVGADEHNLPGEPRNRLDYHFAVPPVEGVYEGGPRPPWQNDGTGYLHFGWSATGELFGEGGSTYFYEVAIRPVEAEGQGAEDSIFSDLEEGDVLHFNISVGDLDAPGAPTDAFYNGFWTVGPSGDNAPETDLVPCSWSKPTAFRRFALARM